MLVLAASIFVFLLGSRLAVSASATVRGPTGVIHGKNSFHGFEVCPAEFSWGLQSRGNAGELEETDMRTEVEEKTSSTVSSIPLESFPAKRDVKVVQCPISSLECAGCVDLTSNKCSQCRPGWVKRGNPPVIPERCTACEDIPYVDGDGKSCPEICSYSGMQLDAAKKAAIIKKGREGLTALDACCGCGGGSLMPTPFAYEDRDFLLGDTVSLKPIPRTADRYVVGEDCALEGHGLSLDSSTGEIKGRLSGTETFSTSCSVTAVQSVSDGLLFNATVHIRGKQLHYTQPSVVLSWSTPIKPHISSNLKAKSFSIVCNPELEWIDRSSFSSDGILKKKTLPGKGPIGGGLGAETLDQSAPVHAAGVNATSPSVALFSQPAGVCSITAKLSKKSKSGTSLATVRSGTRQESEDTAETAARPEEEVEERVSVLAISYSSWPGLFYPSLSTNNQNPSVLLTVAQPVRRAPHVPSPYFFTQAKSRFEQLPPALFTISCALPGTSTADVVLHELSTGDVVYVGASRRERVPLFHMDPHSGNIGGSTAGYPGASVLPWSFDSRLQRQTAEFACKVTAKVVPPAGTGSVTKSLRYLRRDIKVKVQDKVCWQPVKIARREVERYALPNAQTEEACRQQCASSAQCAVFHFDPTGAGGNHKCFKLRRRHTLRPGTDTATLSAHAKLRSCEPRTACVELRLSKSEWMAGTYCPLTDDPKFRGEEVYEKSGFTPEDSAFLLKYSSDRIRGPKGGLNCDSSRPWAIVQASPAHDYVDKENGRVDLTGRLLACLPAPDFQRPHRGPRAPVSALLLNSAGGSPVQDPLWEIVHAPQQCPSPLKQASAAMLEDSEKSKKGESDTEEDRGGATASDVWTFHDPDVTEAPGVPSFNLDPCECFPASWGKNSPVDEEQFDAFPASGRNSVPAGTAKPQVIARGGVSCMFSFLLTSFPDNDEDLCAERCRDNEECNLFWVGLLAGAPHCRLYSECGALMSELSEGEARTSGNLFGLPRRPVCLIANPSLCMSTVKRRKLLTSVEPPIRCPAGYRQVWAQVDGAGLDGYANIPSVEGCATKCNAQAQCQSFEYSPSARHCQTRHTTRTLGPHTDDKTTCLKEKFLVPHWPFSLLEDSTATPIAPPESPLLPMGTPYANHSDADMPVSQEVRVSPVHPHSHNLPVVHPDELTVFEQERARDAAESEGRVRVSQILRGGESEWTNSSTSTESLAGNPLIDTRSGKKTQVVVSLHVYGRSRIVGPVTNGGHDVVIEGSGNYPVGGWLWIFQSGCQTRNGKPTATLRSYASGQRFIWRPGGWTLGTTNRCRDGSGKYQCGCSDAAQLTMHNPASSKARKEGYLDFEGASGKWLNPDQFNVMWWTGGPRPGSHGAMLPVIWQVVGANIAIWGGGGTGYLRFKPDANSVTTGDAVSTNGVDSFEVRPVTRNNHPFAVCLYNKRFNSFLAGRNERVVFRKENTQCNTNDMFWTFSYAGDGTVALWNHATQRYLMSHQHMKSWSLSGVFPQLPPEKMNNWERLRIQYLDPPTDGRFSAWTSWTQCSVPCGSGTQTRTRSCVGQNAGGKDCSELPEARGVKDLYKQTQSCWAGVCKNECLFESILMDCEQKLMLGVGKTIEECGKCKFNYVETMRSDVRPLGESFAWGTEVHVSCKSDRFTLLDLKKSPSRDQRVPDFALTCQDGTWVDRHGSTGFANHECTACVQAGKRELLTLAEQGKEALYFMTRIPVQLTVQLSRFDPHRVHFRTSDKRLVGTPLTVGGGRLAKDSLWYLDTTASKDRFLIESAGMNEQCLAVEPSGCVMEFEGNGCCRGFSSHTNASPRQQTEKGCKALCMASRTCEAFEISQASLPITSPQKYYCYLFHTPVSNFRLSCDTNSGKQRCFRKHGNCNPGTSTTASELLNFENTAETCNASKQRHTWDTELALRVLRDQTVDYLRTQSRGKKFFKASGGMDKASFSRELLTRPFATDGAVVQGINMALSTNPRRLSFSPRVFTFMAGASTARSRVVHVTVQRSDHVVTLACDANSVIQDIRTVSTSETNDQSNVWNTITLEIVCIPLAFSPECTTLVASFDGGQFPGNSPIDAVADINKVPGSSGHMVCEMDKALQAVKLTSIPKSEIVSGETICCTTGGPSVAFQALPYAYHKAEAPLPSSLGAFEEFEGIYCPWRKDSLTGRLDFRQTAVFKRAEVNREWDRRLSFDPIKSRWAISDTPTAFLSSEAAEPEEQPEVSSTAEGISISPKIVPESTLAVLPYTDFEITPAEPPKEKIERPKKPNKPPPPQLKTLSEFNMEEQYLPYCRKAGTGTFPLIKDLNDLNPSTGPDSTQFGQLAAVGEDGELPFAEAYKGPKESVSSIEDNPCGYLLYVQRNESPNVNSDSFLERQPLGPEASGMNFKALLGCFNRDDTREDDFGTEEAKLNEFLNLIENKVEPVIEMGICGPPAVFNTELAPLGTGAEINWGDPCDRIFQTIWHDQEWQKIRDTINMDKYIGNAGINDCNANRDGFAKVICDLSCISDAVRAGNTAILSRLEEVFKTLQSNLLVTMQYHSDYTNELLQWLADLQDFHAASLKDQIAKLPSGTTSGQSFLSRLQECRNRMHKEGQERMSVVGTAEGVEEGEKKNIAKCVTGTDLQGQVEAFHRTSFEHLTSQIGLKGPEKNLTDNTPPKQPLPTLAQRLQHMPPSEVAAFTRRVTAVATSLQGAVRGHVEAGVQELSQISEKLRQQVEEQQNQNSRSRANLRQSQSMTAEGDVVSRLLAAAHAVESELTKVHGTVDSRLQTARSSLFALFQEGVQNGERKKDGDFVSVTAPTSDADSVSNIGAALAQGIRQEHTEILDRVRRSTRRQEDWLDVWAVRLGQRKSEGGGGLVDPFLSSAFHLTRRLWQPLQSLLTSYDSFPPSPSMRRLGLTTVSGPPAVSTPPLSAPPEDNGGSLFKNRMSLAPFGDHQRETLQGLLNALEQPLRDLQQAALVYLQDAQRLQDAEKATTEAVESYLSCEASLLSEGPSVALNAHTPRLPGHHSTESPADRDLYQSLVLPAWRRMQRERRDVVRSLSFAFWKGVATLRLLRRHIEDFDLPALLTHAELTALRYSSPAHWEDMKARVCKAEEGQRESEVAKIIETRLAAGSVGEMMRTTSKVSALVRWLRSRLQRENVGDDLSLLQQGKGEPHNRKGGKSESNSKREEAGEFDLDSESGRDIRFDSVGDSDSSFSSSSSFHPLIPSETDIANAERDSWAVRSSIAHWNSLLFGTPPLVGPLKGGWKEGGVEEERGKGSMLMHLHRLAEKAKMNVAQIQETAEEGSDRFAEREEAVSRLEAVEEDLDFLSALVRLTRDWMEGGCSQ